MAKLLEIMDSFVVKRMTGLRKYCTFSKISQCALLNTNAESANQRCRHRPPPQITKNLQGDTTWKKSFFPFDIGRYIVYGLPPLHTESLLPEISKSYPNIIRHFGSLNHQKADLNMIFLPNWQFLPFISKNMIFIGVWNHILVVQNEKEDQ